MSARVAEDECIICMVPERGEIEKAKADGLETRIIVDWLMSECGYSRRRALAARCKMTTHFQYHFLFKGRTARGVKR